MGPNSREGRWFMLFDSHAHLAPGEQSLDHLLTTMHKLHITSCVVVPGGGIAPGQLNKQLSAPPTAMQARGARYDCLALLRQCESLKGTLFPFYFVNPHQPTDQYRTFASRFYGVKIGPAVHGVPLTSPLTAAYLEVASEFNHLVYLHCLDRDGFRVSDLVTVARNFPTLHFILGHGGIGHLDFAAVDTIAPFEKILFETSGAFAAVVQYACDKLGASRVLFGSEHPLQSAKAELVKIQDLRLSGRDLDLVLGTNIAKLLSGGRA